MDNSPTRQLLDQLLKKKPQQLLAWLRTLEPVAARDPLGSYWMTVWVFTTEEAQSAMLNRDREAALAWAEVALAAYDYVARRYANEPCPWFLSSNHGHDISYTVAEHAAELRANMISAYGTVPNHPVLSEEMRQPSSVGV